MTASGSLSYFAQHRGSKSCKKGQSTTGCSSKRRSDNSPNHGKSSYSQFMCLYQLFPHKVPSRNASSSVPPLLSALPQGSPHQPLAVTSPRLPSMDEDELSDLAASMADLRSSSPIPDIGSSQKCTGVLVEWTAGSVWVLRARWVHGTADKEGKQQCCFK